MELSDEDGLFQSSALSPKVTASSALPRDVPMNSIPLVGGALVTRSRARSNRYEAEASDRQFGVGPAAYPPTWNWPPGPRLTAPAAVRVRKACRRRGRVGCPGGKVSNAVEGPGWHRCLRRRRPDLPKWHRRQRVTVRGEPRGTGERGRTPGHDSRLHRDLDELRAFGVRVRVEETDGQKRRRATVRSTRWTSGGRAAAGAAMATSGTARTSALESARSANP